MSNRKENVEKDVKHIFKKPTKTIGRASTNQRRINAFLAIPLLFMFVIVPSLVVQNVVAGNSPSIVVASDMSTLTAGAYNNVTLTITNTGDYTASQVNLAITLPNSGSGSAIMILNGTDSKFVIGDIGAHESTTLTVTVYVSTAAVGNLYQLTFTFTYTYGTTKTDTRTLGYIVPILDANAPSANLDVSLTTQDLKAGNTNDINLIIKNVGDSVAQSLTVSLTLPGAQSSSSSYILLESDGTWLIDSIAPGEEVIIPLRIFITSSASGTGATFTVTNTYTDMQYKSKQQVNYLGVVVRGSVDIVVLSSSTYPQTVIPGNPFSFTVAIINLGTTTAQSVIVSPSGASEIMPFSNSSIFLGDLNVNIPSSLTVSYIAGNVKNGVYNISLDYSYKNSLGQKLTDHLDTTLVLKVGTNSTDTSSSTQQTALLSPLQLTFLAVLLAIAFVVMLYFFRRHQSRSKQ